MKTTIKKVIVTTLLGISLGFVGMGSARAMVQRCDTIEAVAKNAYTFRVTGNLQGDAYLNKLDKVAKGNDYSDAERKIFVGIGLFFNKTIEEDGYYGMEAMEMLENECKKVGPQRLATRFYNRGEEFLLYGLK